MLVPAAAQLLVALGLGALLVLASAKAHGRQVRLERELQGVYEVRFGGENPPLVEALWRRDRIRWWTTLSVALVALGAWLYAGDVGAAWYPTLFANDASFGWSLLVVPLWAMSAAFVVAGLWSHAALLRELKARETIPPTRWPWREEALRGSAAWWSLVGALLALAATVAL